MSRDRLYQLAFEYKKTKLWKKIGKEDLFAVQFSNGRLGYCSAEGMFQTEDLGLFIYFENGMYDFYQSTQDVFELRPWERLELETRRNAIGCVFRCKGEMPPGRADEMTAYCKANKIRLSGANACPSFERLLPYRMQWYSSEAEEAMIGEALEAALDVADKLKNAKPEKLGLVRARREGVKIPLLVRQGGGFVWKSCTTPKASAPKLPSPRVRHELLVMRVRKQKKTDAEWNCAMIVHPQMMLPEKPPVGAELTEPPILPMIFFVQDGDTGEIIGTYMDHMYPASAEDFCNVLLQMMMEHGKPDSINALDERTELLIRTAAGQVGIRLRRDESNSFALEMLKNYYIHFNGPYVDMLYDDDEDDDYDDFPDDMEYAELAKMLAQISLDDIPDDVLRDMMHTLIEKPMPRDVTLKVFNEWMKRFLR